MCPAARAAIARLAGLLCWMALLGDVGRAREIWLDVPYVRQSRNGCGSACISMIIQYWDNKTSAASSIRENETQIFRRLYSGERKGIAASAIESYLSQQGFKVFAFNGAWPDLERHISMGRPLIVCLKKGNASHYIVVAGIDSELGIVLANDPAGRKLQKVKRKQFEKEWSESDGWTLLAMPLSGTRQADSWSSRQNENEDLSIPSRNSANAEYDRGLALAHQGRWEEARRLFESGFDSSPSDPRFALELAGIAFKLGSLSESKRFLRRALKIDPDNAYGNDFMATLYSLDDNLEAALKFWNRIGKPLIEDVRIDPPLRLDPILLDRAFSFSPAARLELRDLVTTESHLSLIESFSSYRFDLVPRQDNRFDLVFHALERGGGGTPGLGSLLSTFREIPYQAVHMDFMNISGSGVNIETLFRWDPDKRRVSAALSGPFGNNARWRYRFWFDGRNENWEIRPTPHSMPALQFNLRRAEAGAGITAVTNQQWKWAADISISTRRYDGSNTPDITSPFFSDRGLWIKYALWGMHPLLYLPERRLEIKSMIDGQFARNLSGPPSRFLKLESGLEGEWLPMARGNDYRISGSVRAGATGGRLPFDEYYALGVERDNDLYLRGHSGTYDGKKGAGPLGRDYILLNCEMDKIVHHNAFWDISVGPLFDSGRTYGLNALLESGRWLYDVGIQSKITIPGGLSVSLSYGRDLRSGMGTFFTSIRPIASRGR